MQETEEKKYFLRGNTPEKNAFEAEKLVKNNSLQGKYSERKNTTKEGEHIDGDVLCEKILDREGTFGIENFL